MNKTDLIEIIAQHADISPNRARNVLQGLLDGITDALKSGNDVTITGFGTFTISHRAARTGRNPQTGETISIPSSKVPRFKAGRLLRDAISS